jgi:hypothetical protein
MRRSLVEDKRNYSKSKEPSQQDHQAEPAAASAEAANKAVPTPAEAGARAEAQPEMSSNPEAAPVPGAGRKGGLFSCFPCC